MQVTKCTEVVQGYDTNFGLSVAFKKAVLGGIKQKCERCSSFADVVGKTMKILYEVTVGVILDVVPDVLLLS